MVVCRDRSQKVRYRALLLSLFALLVCSGAACLWPACVHSQAATPKAEEGGGDKLNEDELAKDSTTEINVKNADITAIIRIFSKKTKRNFILDERVKGKVSIYLPGRVSAEESIRILDSVLSYKGFAAVPIGENLWKIVPSKEARQTTIPTQLEDPDNPSSSMVTRLVQLKFIGADEARQVLTPLVSTDGLLNAYPGTNSLIVIDSEDNIARLMGIVENLDVPFSNRDMTIIPIVHADAVDIAAKLNEILGLSSGTAAGRGGAEDSGLDLLRARMREMAGAAQAARNAAMANAAPGSAPPQAALSLASGATDSGTTAPRSHQPKIIADERTNSIIVVADEETTARIQALVSQLDSKIDLSGSRYWVYRCQHAKADELAEVLSGLSGGSAGGTAARRGTAGGADEDLIGGSSRMSGSSNRTSSSTSRSQERLRSQQRVPGESRLGSRSGGGVTGVTLGEDISITADPATNSLIIFAGKNDYLKIKGLLDKLDIKRRQVLVEATLLEVGIDDSHTESMAWIASGGGEDGGILAQSNGSDIINLLSNPSSVQSFSIAAASAGTLKIGDSLTIPSQSILLNALQSNSNVNVLSAPTILTTDNEEAEIVVGENVPFIASTSTTEENLNNTFNQIDRQDVGITLRLTPQISSDDNVTLRVFTEVSNVKTIDPRLGPTTTIRTSETNIIARDAQMIVIGGLMADGVDESDSGVPYLKDIPMLGYLFESSTQRVRRTNLLILITPRIVKDQYDARDYTREGAQEFEADMNELGIAPKWSDALKDPAIDRVAETEEFSGQAPSTIRDPKGAKQEAGRESSAPLEFDAVPLAPEGAESAAPPPRYKDSSTDARAGAAGEVLSFEASAVAPLAESFGAKKQLAKRERFVVIRPVGDSREEGAAALPFTVSQAHGVAGIVLPESAPKADQFFQAGSALAYRHGAGDTPLEIVGIFGSVEEAAALYPELGSGASGTAWYTLSPHEILQLGAGPWVRSEARLGNDQWRKNDH